jgi:DNA-binding transcriptional ArsR family regulator
VDETEYWKSRLCRLLANLVMYELVVLLNTGGAMTRSKLAKAAGRPVQTVSGHLAKLRSADLVRYGEKRVTNSLRENSSGAKKLKRVLKNTYSRLTLKTL